MTSTSGFTRRVAFFLSVLFTLAAVLSINCFSADLLLFAGAGLRQPTDHLVKVFQKETGHRVRVSYAGSGQLLTTILASGEGDLFMPGAVFYIEKLEKMGRIVSHTGLVAHTAVVGVNIHKAGLIGSFDDMAKPGVRLGMGDPKAMAFGRVAQKIINRSPLWEAIRRNVVVYAATVKQLALYVAQGDVDAAIIGRADAFQFRSQVRMLDIPKEYFQRETVAIAVLEGTTHPDLAAHFSDFMASESSLKVFLDFGFLALTSGENQKKRP